MDGPRQLSKKKGPWRRRRAKKKINKELWRKDWPQIDIALCVTGWKRIFLVQKEKVPSNSHPACMNSFYKKNPGVMASSRLWTCWNLFGAGRKWPESRSLSMFRIHLVSCCVEEKHSRSHREKITHVSRDKLRNKGHHLNSIKNQTYLFMIFISLFSFWKKEKKNLFVTMSCCGGPSGFLSQ